MFWSLDQLDFRNLTDMVNGPPPPGVVLVADRPKVIYNNLTKLYVMFMHLEYAVDHDPTPDNSRGSGYASGGQGNAGLYGSGIRDRPLGHPQRSGGPSAYVS